MTNIDEIEARLKAATPGPWLVAYDADHPMNGGMPFNFVVATIGNDTIAEDLCGDDARFIAHATEDVAALIAEVRRLSAENARLREEVVRLQDLVNCDCDSETRKALDRANMGRTLDLAETIRLRAELARVTADFDAARREAGDVGLYLMRHRATAEADRDAAIARAEAAEASAARGWSTADSLHITVKEQRERAEAAEKRDATRIEGIMAQIADLERDRDHWRTVAESRPDISREDAGKVALAPTDDLAAVIRVSDALRDHAAAPKGDDTGRAGGAR